MNSVSVRTSVRRTLRPMACALILCTGVASAATFAPPTIPPPGSGSLPTLAPKVDGGDAVANAPDVDTILANYVKAIGGDEKLRAVTSRRTTGQFEMDQMPGMAMSMVLEAKAPNFLVMTLEIPGMGEMKQGFDGTVGWSMDPMQGPMLMPEEQLTQFRREANFHKDLNLREGFEKAEVVGRTDFEGHDTWQVKMTAENGDPVTLHFGADDHLLWGLATTARTPMGEMESRTIIKEYQEFDGIKTAAKTEIHTMGMKQTLTVKKVEIDVVEASAFELPAPIKSLVEAKNEREKESKPAESGS